MRMMSVGGVKLALACLGLVIAAEGRAQTVNMSVTDYTHWTDLGITATINNVSAIAANDYIGIYSFTVNSVSGGTVPISNPFYSVCLSPEGVLTGGAYNYNVKSFAQANGGINPNGLWASSGSSYYGIQNANYLFTTLQAGVRSGPDAGNQGAALALAMYTALYNSTGYGFNLGGTAFKITGESSTVAADVANDLKVLSSFTDYSSLPTGSVLQPANTSQGGPSGQDMLLGTPVPQTIGVPEPATVLAGLLLLLPFCASAFRIVRSRKLAVQFVQTS